jgi:hypothetical protein
MSSLPKWCAYERRTPPAQLESRPPGVGGARTAIFNVDQGAKDVI